MTHAFNKAGEAFGIWILITSLPGLLGVNFAFIDAELFVFCEQVFDHFRLNLYTWLCAGYVKVDIGLSSGIFIL